MICARCHRTIRHPVHVAGMALGAKCAAAVTGAKPRRERSAPAQPDAKQRDLFEVQP